jgi:hypothetical protein
MKILAGALAIGALSWGAVNAVSDAPPTIQPRVPPAAELEREPAARSWAMQPGAFCPMADKPCTLHPHHPAQWSLSERWQRWMEASGQWIARAEQQLLSHIGYPHLAGDSRQP